MTVRMLNASATLSTSAGSWRKCEAASLNFNSASNYYDDANTPRTSGNFTTAAVNIQGVVIAFRRLVGAGTITVYLMEGATQRAVSAAFDLTTLTATSGWGWVYIAFSTPYAASAATNYQIKVTCDTVGRFYWARSSTASDWSYAVVGDGDDSSKIASGDTAIINNSQTLTVDESLTLAATGNFSLIHCNAAVFSVPNPSGPITIAFGAGKISLGGSGQFLVGSSGTPISAGRVTITNSLTANYPLFEFYNYSYVTAGTPIIACYGATSTGLRLTLSADAAAGPGASVLNTIEDIPASWTVGDTIVLAAKDSGDPDTRVYLLKSKGTKTISLEELRTATISIASPAVVTITSHALQDGSDVVFTTTGALPTGVTAGTTYYSRTTGTSTFNLYDTYAHAIAGGSTGRVNTSGSQSGTHTCTSLSLNIMCLASGGIVNITEGTRLGIQFVSTNQTGLSGLSISFSTGTIVDYLVLQGVNFINMSIIWGQQSIASTASNLINSVLAYFNSSGTCGLQLNSIYKSGCTIQNAHFINQQATYAGMLINAKNATISNITFRMCAATATNMSIGGTNVSLTDAIYAHGYNGAGSETFVLTGYGHSLTNVRIIGGSVYFINCAQLSISNFKQQRTAATNPRYGLYLSNAVGILATSCTFGVGSGNTTRDIYFATDGLVQMLCVNCNIGSMGIDNWINSVPGSFIRFVNYNGTPNDNRAWYTIGRYQSNSGKLDSWSDIAASILTSRYRIYSEDIANEPLRFEVGCKIGAAGYYAGTRQAPRLNVDYDSSSTAYNEASENTDQQTLAQNVTPTLGNAELAVRLTEKTDASTDANKLVTWSDLIIKKRAYGKVYTQLSYPITKTTDDIIYTLPTSVTNSFITQATKSTVAAYTGIAVNLAASTITLTVNHTIQELYDYCQYVLGEATGLPYADFFATIDGTNFTGSFDLTVDGCTLSGAGKTINMPTMTLTLANGGAVTALVTDINGTAVPVTLSGLVVGSQCYVAKASDGTEIMNTTADAGSESVTYVYTADVNVVIRVRKAGYLEASYSAVISATGLSQIVSQVADTVYA